MALTFSKKDDWVEGPKRFTAYDVTFDNSYLAGGEVVTPRQVGLTTKIDRAVASGATDYYVDCLPQSDGTLKLKVLTSNGAAPAKLLDFTSTGDLSATTARVTFQGV
jgi:hypothetical protein